jgi:hypothetical protein
MTLQELANLGEALSGFAVLISLIYLILEVRRNSRLVRTTSAWNADIALAELNEIVGQNPQLSALCMRGLDANTNPEDLSPEEFAQFFFLCRAVFQKYQAQWSLWREGSLSDEMWQNRRRWAKAFISLPVPSRIWERERDQHQFSAGFVASIDSMSITGDLRVGV